MKKLASMLVGLAALAAAPAMAADMPVKYVPPAPPPVFSWSGCYIGRERGAARQCDEREACEKQLLHGWPPK